MIAVPRSASLVALVARGDLSPRGRLARVLGRLGEAVAALLSRRVAGKVVLDIPVGDVTGGPTR